MKKEYIIIKPSWLIKAINGKYIFLATEKFMISNFVLNTQLSRKYFIIERPLNIVYSVSAFCSIQSRGVVTVLKLEGPKL